MENKLQELTRKLYDEGLSKGRQEADSLLEKSRVEASRIVEDAQKEAEKIRRDARNSAEDLRKNTLTELNLAGKQVTDQLKNSIRDMVVARSLDGAVTQATMDPAFIKDILIAVASNWQGNSTGKAELSVMLPESQREQLNKTISEAVTGALSSETDIVWSEDVKSGFRIGPKEGGYYISFTDESFRALLEEYLRPHVSSVLFGLADNA